MTDWIERFEQTLEGQQTFLQFTEQAMLTELRSFFPQDFDPRLGSDLIDAALLRRLSQQPFIYEDALHAPWREDGIANQEVPEERRNRLIKVIDDAASEMLHRYQDYLLEHWRTVHHRLDHWDEFRRRTNQLLQAHLQSLAAALEPQQFESGPVHELRERIEDLVSDWHGQSALLALTEAEERETLRRRAQAHWPMWYKLLNEDQRNQLRYGLQDWIDAKRRVDGLCRDVNSLEDHARVSCDRYLADRLGKRMAAGRITIKLQLLGAPTEQSQTMSLDELAALGAQQAEGIYRLSDISSSQVHCTPPTIEQIQQMLADLDAPGTYLKAWTDLHDSSEFKQAAFDAAHADFAFRALKARFASHLRDTHHDLLAKLPDEANGLSVCRLNLFDLALCRDLLLFFREHETGEPSDLLLYAPDKPDGQEWVELSSLKALNVELGGWMADERGQAYLLWQLPPAHHEAALERMGRIRRLPVTWNLYQDLRGPSKQYRACVEEAGEERLAEERAKVLLDSPEWYRALTTQERMRINALRYKAEVSNVAFMHDMAQFESFRDYATRTIGTAIKPYLQSKGVNDPVDPRTVAIDFTTTELNLSIATQNLYPLSPLATSISIFLGLFRTRETHLSVNLVDFVCYGYTDNSTIDHPSNRVRSTVGQDLSSLRSADFAQYARRGYVGERYIAHVRETYLNKNTPLYRRQRVLLGQKFIASLERDACIALAREQLSNHDHECISAQIGLLKGSLEQERPENTSEDVAGHDGIFRFTLDGHTVLGVYVLRCLKEGRASDWLYTPDGPGDVLFVTYGSLGAHLTPDLRHYLLERTPLIALEKVRVRLQALHEENQHVDSLRGINQVVNIAQEYDNCIEHGLKDVDDTTQGRADVIRQLALRGLTFGSLPLALACPPFAYLLTAYFFVQPLRAAIIAHTRGNNAEALEQWLWTSVGLLGGLALVPGIGTRALTGLMRGMRITTGKARPAHLEGRQHSFIFDKSWARPTKPEHLQLVTEAGIWKGTYRSGIASESAGAEYFILKGGRYFKVVEDAEWNTLRLVKHGRSGYIYRDPIRLSADGRWVANHANVGGPGGGSSLGDWRFNLNSTLGSGEITSLNQLLRHGGRVNVSRGALQGEAVFARSLTGAENNYLFTLNAQNNVAVSLYNVNTRSGVVMHIDHNIGPRLTEAVEQAMGAIRAAPGHDIRAVMAGGEWLSSGPDIGGAVRSALRQANAHPDWSHWSFASPLPRNYGLWLDLDTGVTRVFSHRAALFETTYQAPNMRSYLLNDLPLNNRFIRFRARVRRGPYHVNRNGLTVDQYGNLLVGHRELVDIRMIGEFA